MFTFASRFFFYGTFNVFEVHCAWQNQDDIPKLLPIQNHTRNGQGRETWLYVGYSKQKLKKRHEFINIFSWVKWENKNGCIYSYFFLLLSCHYSWIQIRPKECLCVCSYLLNRDTPTNAPNIWSNECFPFHTIFIEKRWQRAHMSHWWLFTKEIHRSRRWRETIR